MNNIIKKKVILAFSGGLDTSYCAVYLQKEGFDVICVTVDTGGFSNEELSAIKEKAENLGIKKAYIIDAKQKLYDEIFSYFIKGNVLRGGVYPSSAGAERLIQAKEVIEIAKKEKAYAIAHGSTAAGNDIIRFNVAIKTLAPEIKIIAPIAELGLTRVKEAEYLKLHGYKVSNTQKEYSINQGMLGTTIGGKETLDSWQVPPDSVYPNVIPIEKTPNQAEEIIISFEKGLPVKINGEKLESLTLIKKLADIGNKHGAGKNIHLGDTILGIKGRIAFEASAITIAIKAHKELEKLVLTKWQQFWKGTLSEVYGNFLHEALFFEPLIIDIQKFIDSTQDVVTGDVKVKLFKGNVIIEGVKSPYSMMNKEIANYGEDNKLWTGSDVMGFTQIYGLQGILAQKAKLLGNKNEKN